MTKPTHRLRWILIAAATVLALGAGAVVWLFYSGDAPPPADLDTAAKAVRSPSGNATPVVVDGRWVVDPGLGKGDGDGGSFAGFRVEEELARFGHNTAVGRTADVTGTIEISGTRLTSADVKVDLTTIQSDEFRRDRRIQEALDTSKYPDATFKLTQPVDLGAIPDDGKRIKVEAEGDLTIHGVTKAATVSLEAERSGAVVTVTGSTPVTFADFDVETPTAPMVLSVDEKGTIEFQLYLKKA